MPMKTVGAYTIAQDKKLRGVAGAGDTTRDGGRNYMFERMADRIVNWATDDEKSENDYRDGK